MSNSQAKKIDTNHHIKGLRPALHIMSGLGFSNEECLKDTGLSLEQLNDVEQGLSLDQEFKFYRQLLRLTEDPHIGLKLGQAYRLESYGVFGYAILSAQTLGEGLAMASEFSQLSFSHFDISLEITGATAHLQMRQAKPLDQDLLRLYEDRDCSAILAGAVSALGQAFPIIGIQLMHEETGHQAIYEEFYGCPVSFDHAQMEIVFNVAILKQAMPLRDPETADYCRRQCDKLLNTQEHRSAFGKLVKEFLHASAKQCFPGIKEVATQLHTSERTLRRKLNDEGCSFQSLTSEVRFELAQTYLSSDLSLEHIAQRLGYSEAANFSHAFKRWSGISPKQYRQRITANP